MSLSIDGIIRVTDSIEPVGILQRTFGIGLLLTTDSQLGTGSNRIAVLSSFMDAEGLFSVGSAPYIAAQTWFAQSPLPQNLIIGRWINTAVAAILKGGALTSTLVQLKAITNGSFNIVVDGVSHDITGVDLSTATSFADVATAIQTKITTAGASVTVAFNPVSKGFVVTEGTTGDASTLSFFAPVTPASGTDLSVPLALTLATGASLSQGSDAELVEEALVAIQNLNNSFYFVMLDAILNDTATVSSVSAWCEDQRLMYSAGTADAQTLVTGDTTSESAQLFDLQPERTWMTYSKYADQKSVSIAARLSSVNFSANNSLITLKFKSLPGCLPDDFNVTQQTELLRKRVNYYTEFSGDAIYAEGQAFENGIWVDVRYALDWFVNAVQVSVYDLLRQSNRVGQTDSGEDFIVDSITTVCQQAVRNGMIAPGTVSDALKNDIIQTTGNTEFDGFLSKGYLIWSQPTALQTQSDRDERKATAKKIWLKSGGAIHSADIAIVLEN